MKDFYTSYLIQSFILVIGIIAVMVLTGWGILSGSISKFALSFFLDWVIGLGIMFIMLKLDKDKE